MRKIIILLGIVVVCFPLAIPCLAATQTEPKGQHYTLHPDPIPVRTGGDSVLINGTTNFPDGSVGTFLLNTADAFGCEAFDHDPVGYNGQPDVCGEMYMPATRAVTVKNGRFAFHWMVASPMPSTSAWADGTWEFRISSREPSVESPDRTMILFLNRGLATP